MCGPWRPAWRPEAGGRRDGDDQGRGGRGRHAGGRQRAVGEHHVELVDREFAEQGSRLTYQASGGQGASLLGLFLPPEYVRRVARRELGVVLDEPIVFPALHRHEPSLSMPLLRLAQVALREGGNGPGVGPALDEIVVTLLRSQARLESMVPKCPGRSPRYRRQVLMRLLRARSHIEHVAGADCSLGRLAEIARMSPTHFLRLYRDVFGQTPHKDVVATRLAAATVIKSISVFAKP
mgnify:CR=1 FL=1